MLPFRGSGMPDIGFGGLAGRNCKCEVCARPMESSCRSFWIRLERSGQSSSPYLIVLGVIWRIESSPEDESGNGLATSRIHPNRIITDDDLHRRLEDIEEKLELHRKHITQIKRRLRGAGVIIFALICASVSL